jgi:hypothetical protein
MDYRVQGSGFGVQGFRVESDSLTSFNGADRRL